MDTVQPIVNKVAQKALVNIDLELFFPKQEEIVAIDLKQYLFKELILKEADFRAAIKQTDWTTYQDKYVVLHCSANAVVPMWAYMVVSAEVAAFAQDVACSEPEHAPEIFLYRNIAKMDLKNFEGKRVVVKGCGARPIPEAAFVQIAQQLSGIARTINYGEACSMVPVYKKSVEH